MVRGAELAHAGNSPTRPQLRAPVGCAIQHIPAPFCASACEWGGCAGAASHSNECSKGGCTGACPCCAEWQDANFAAKPQTTEVS